MTRSKKVGTSGHLRLDGGRSSHKIAWHCNPERQQKAGACSQCVSCQIPARQRNPTALASQQPPNPATPPKKTVLDAHRWRAKLFSGRDGAVAGACCMRRPPARDQRSPHVLSIAPLLRAGSKRLVCGFPFFISFFSIAKKHISDPLTLPTPSCFLQLHLPLLLPLYTSKLARSAKKYP